LLRGKCHHCGEKISPRYVIVEFITGLLFLCSWLKYGDYNPYIAIVISLFIALLIVASFIDFEHFIIPDEITIGGIAFGLIVSVVLPSLHQSSTCYLHLNRVYLAQYLGHLLFILLFKWEN
jgi:leader peptidase (prepilin peptidase)/N-methyltransferase